MEKHEDLDLEGAIKREREEEEKSGDKEQSESVGDSENADDDGVKEEEDSDDDKGKHPKLGGDYDEEDSENSEEDSDLDNDGDWSDLSEFEDEDMPEKIPTSMAFPASLLRYVQEKHNPRPSDDTVLVNILEDDEGLAREGTYSVWEMKSPNRKIKMERISVALRILMVVECCLALSDRLNKKGHGK